MDEDGGNAADDADDALRVTARILSDGDDDPDGGRDHDDGDNGAADGDGF